MGAFRSAGTTDSARTLSTSESLLSRFGKLSGWSLDGQTQGDWERECAGEAEEGDGDPLGTPQHWVEYQGVSLR